MSEEKIIRSNEKRDNIKNILIKDGNLLDLIEIKVGGVYKYDVNKILNIRKGVANVIVNELIYRGKNKNPLAKVQSLETGEELELDIGHIQNDPNVLKEKYKEAISIQENFLNNNIKLLKGNNILKKSRVSRLVIVLSQSRNLFEILTDKGYVTQVHKEHLLSATDVCLSKDGTPLILDISFEQKDILELKRKEFLAFKIGLDNAIDSKNFKLACEIQEKIDYLRKEFDF